MRTMVPPSLPKGAQEIVKGRLYFASLRKHPNRKLGSKLHFFSVDSTLKYLPFFADFGPLNLGQLYRFCCQLSDKLADAERNDKTVVFYCRAEPKKFANAAYLIGAFQIICLGRTTADAFEPFKNTAFIPFRDASMGPCNYQHTVEHCLEAIEKAKNHKFLDFQTFNVEEYEFYERVECGDFNIIVPGKFLAFSGPNNRTIDAEGYPALTPAHYVPIFSKMGVSTIIRLNRRCYDRRRFTEKGFTHFDLIYPDGTIPPPRVLETFLEICAAAPGIVAVHCKAGLGRTGTLIACYMMRFWGWTARECIAWIRICRPGSVIGPQQYYLHDRERELLRLYKKDRANGGGISSIAHPTTPASLMPRALANPREAADHRAPPPVQAAAGSEQQSAAAGSLATSGGGVVGRLSRDANGSWTRQASSAERHTGASSIKDLDFGDEDHFRAAPAAVLALSSPLSQAAAASAAMATSFINAARLGFSSRAENTPRNYTVPASSNSRSSGTSGKAAASRGGTSRSSSTTSASSTRGAGRSGKGHPKLSNKSKKDKKSDSAKSGAKLGGHLGLLHRKSSLSSSSSTSASGSSKSTTSASTSASASTASPTTKASDCAARRTSDGFAERVDALQTRRYVIDADRSVRIDSRSPTGLRPDQISQGRYLLNAKRGVKPHTSPPATPSTPPAAAALSPIAKYRAARTSSLRPTPIHKLRLASASSSSSSSKRASEGGSRGKHTVADAVATTPSHDDLWSATVTSTGGARKSDHAATLAGKRAEETAKVGAGKSQGRSGARRRLFD